MENLRKMCINLTHYNLEQRKSIYNYLSSLNEPISRNNSSLKWITEENYTGKLEYVFAFVEYLGFSKDKWICLTSGECKDRDLIEVDFNKFLSNDIKTESLKIMEWLLKSDTLSIYDRRLINEFVDKYR